MATSKKKTTPRNPRNPRKPRNASSNDPGESAESRQSGESEQAASPGSAATREELGRCIACQSTNLRVRHKIKDQQHIGRTPDGEPYTRIVRRRCKCDDCGQHQMKISREYHPSEWPGENPA